jgi:transposase
MANHLTMALIDTILTLRQRRWSQRRIARELGIDRDTVARYLQAHAAQAKAANAPIGSDPAAQAKAANAPIGSDPAGPAPKAANAPIGSDSSAATSPGPDAAAAAPTTAQAPSSPAGLDHGPAADPTPTPHGPGRASDCEPWRQLILDKLALGLSAQRIVQDLSAEHGYRGSYYSVRRFVHRLEQRTPLPFRRLECGPGEEAQVDFGSGAPICQDNRRRRSHVLRIVLSHSRKAYSEAVYHQTTDDFIACLENAFWAFGGTPQRLVLDNLKAAVTKADWFDPELNPKVRAFAAHYGVALLPTRPYTPRHKGKVERGVDYVQENALKGRRFASLEEQNDFLRDWELTVADTRVHGTIRQQVGKLFAQAERPALLPLPAERFPFFHEGQRTVHRDGHVEVSKAYYSVPPEYLGRRVWVRWDARLVRVFNERLEQVAAHARQEPGRFSTQAQHIAAAKIAGVERGAVWLLGRIRLLGAGAAQWAEAVIEHRGIEGVRVLQGLLSLAGRHASASIDQACGLALSYGEYRLRTVRALIGRDEPRQAALPFVEEHPLIRSLADYAELVRTSFHKER